MPGGVAYDATASMVNMPGGTHPDLLQPQPLNHNRMSVSMGEVQVDPQLLDFEPTNTPLPTDTGNSFGNQNDFWQFNTTSNQHYVPGYMSTPETDQYHHATLPPSSMATGLVADRVMWPNAHTMPGEELNEWFGVS